MALFCTLGKIYKSCFNQHNALYVQLGQKLTLTNVDRESNDKRLQNSVSLNRGKYTQTTLAVGAQRFAHLNRFI